MKISVHADDLGLSRAVNEAIFAAYDDSALAGASLVVNGPELDHACAGLRLRPGLWAVLHLNLFEGRALAGPCPELTDRHGNFRHGFASLWLATVFASRPKRARYRAALARECRAQLARMREALGRDRPLALDGHLHAHMIPLVLETLVALARETPIARMRLPREAFFAAPAAPGARSAYFGANLVKHLLLNRLAAHARRIMDAEGIAHNDYFVGVLFTGRMSPPVVEQALKALTLRRDVPRTIAVEILFHPGPAAAVEEHAWFGRPAYRHFYFSPARAAETRALHDPALRETLARYATK